MRKRIIVLGGGTGGTLLANRLRRLLDRDTANIVVIDSDDQHLYQPGLLFVPFGLATPARLVRPRHRQLRRDITFRRATVDRVDTSRNQVALADGTVLGYDVLVIATGARLIPEETEGLTGPGWMEKTFTFYTLDGAVGAGGSALSRFGGGRIVVAVMDMPIKCPVAPLEFCFLADWYFRKRGVREKVQLTFVTPLDGAFTKRPPATASSAACWRTRASAWSPSSTPARSTAQAGAWSPTTAARSRSTWPWSSRCTAARPTSSARPAWTTN